MVVRMRSTRSHTGNRRSHHALEPVALAKCECGAMHRRHTACQDCGKYRGKQVIDVVARTERSQRRAARKTQEAQEMGQKQAPEAVEKEEKTAKPKKTDK